MLYDIIDRYYFAHGHPPKCINASVGFRREFYDDVAQYYDPPIFGSDFEFCGVLVCCRLHVKHTVLIAA